MKYFPNTKYGKIDGKIKARGWLLEHLLRDKDGITGNLDKLFEDARACIFEGEKVEMVHKDFWSSWWAGETEGNWLFALTLLAFALDDDELKQRVKDKVYSVIAHQGDDGYIGIYKPGHRYTNGDRSGEMWAQSRIMLVMLNYYYNTNDAVVLDALFKMADELVQHFGKLADNRSFYAEPDSDGSKGHGLMIVEPLLMLYALDNSKHDYIDYCEFMYADYSAHAPDYLVGDMRMPVVLDPTIPWVGHGPHACENLRVPMLLHNATGKAIYLSAYNAGLAKLANNTTLSGSCKSDELVGSYRAFVSDDNRLKFDFEGTIPLPTAGYEYCSTTELIFNHIYDGLRGNLDCFDKEEWLAYNAAMAAKHHDGKSILYLCADNLAKATKEMGDRWDYSPTHSDAAVCCAPNSGKVFPFHLLNAWLMEDDATVVAALYCPCELETTVAGERLNIVQETNYPFDESITMRINAAPSSEVTLKLRIPQWADGYTLLLNGKAVGVREGSLHCVSGTFKTGDTLELTLSAPIRLHKSPIGTTAISRGTLLYSRDIPADEHPYHTYAEDERFKDIDMLPQKGAKSNYTLLLDNQGSPHGAKHQYIASPTYPWQQSPCTINVMALDEWAMREYIALVPIGCTLLRQTAFATYTINDGLFPLE